MRITSACEIFIQFLLLYFYLCECEMFKLRHTCLLIQLDHQHKNFRGVRKDGLGFLKPSFMYFTIPSFRHLQLITLCEMSTEKENDGLIFLLIFRFTLYSIIQDLRWRSK